MTTPEPRPSIGEELANSLTHGLGLLLAVAALSVLVTFASLNGEPYRIVACSVYGASLVILYLASTLYHAVRAPRAKRMLRIFDHAAIYLLIAGTYTPFTLVSLRGGWGWTLFGLVWGLGMTGVLLKLVFHTRFEVLSTLAYVAMGWVVLVAIKPVAAALPASGIAWLVAGGLAYTLGVIFYAWERPYHHAIWHLFVLAGSAFHFVAVLRYVVPL